MRDLLQSLMQFDLNQLRDWEGMGAWPLAVKGTLWALAFLLALGLGHWLHVAGMSAELRQARAEESRLRAAVSARHAALAPLAAHRSQTQRMQAALAAALRQLPKDADISALLDDITAAGAAQGLAFDSIDLGAEAEGGFYVATPISIAVRGGYHSLGAFASDLAQLPRLLTLHDFTLLPDDGGGALVWQVEARTYRRPEADDG